MKFTVGDMVRPRPEWRDNPNRVPTGRVREVITWGDDQMYYVGDERRAFIADVFEKDE
jgi:hypothetical protein